MLIGKKAKSAEEEEEEEYLFNYDVSISDFTI
jgi:hypothetical protein